MAEMQMERLERIVRDFNKATPWVLSKADMAWLLDRAEIAILIPRVETAFYHMPEPIAAHEELATKVSEEILQRQIANGLIKGDNQDALSLENCIRFVERWKAVALPANELGQIPLGRMLIDSCLDTMKAELSRKNGTTCDDEGCPHYGTPHGHGDAG